MASNLDFESDNSNIEDFCSTHTKISTNHIINSLMKYLT